MSIPDGIGSKHILAAVRELDAGAGHRFGESVGYDVLINGRRYAPKAVVGLAAAHLGVAVSGPSDFRGGLGSRCFRVLEANGFSIVPKMSPPEANSVGTRRRRTSSVVDTFRLRARDGRELDAALATETIGDFFGLVIESHGGGRNRDYMPAVEEVLERLQRAGLSRLQVRLVSRGVLQDAPSGQLIGFGGSDWLRLIGETPQALRGRIGELVRGVRTSETAQGAGNARKRILLDAGIDAGSWRSILWGERASADQDTEAPRGRERVLASITARRGQAAFRQSLLRAYDGRCAVTGTEEDGVLEAAHIEPYDGTITNRTGNGLLLRSDIHTLFDLGLLSVSIDGTISVDDAVGEPMYRMLHGRSIRWPARIDDHPEVDALAARAALNARAR